MSGNSSVERSSHDGRLLVVAADDLRFRKPRNRVEKRSIPGTDDAERMFDPLLCKIGGNGVGDGQTNSPQKFLIIAATNSISSSPKAGCSPTHSESFMT